MNAITRQLTRLTMLAALLAAAFTMQSARAADHNSQPQQLRVVQLPPVVVVGKRVRVIELERVVIVAKRQTPTAGMLVAQRNARGQRG
jgi:hypothetical protein